MQKMLTVWSVIVVFLVMLSTSVSFAQVEVCAGGYPRSDRPHMVRAHYELDFYLSGLAETAQFIAQYGASGEYTESYKEQWDLQVDWLNNAYSYNNGPISAAGTDFIRAVANSEYLGIPNLFPDGVSSGETLLANARETLDKVNLARFTFKKCMYGSWAKVAMTDPAPASCRHIYNYTDTNVVISQLVKGLRYLHSMRDIAEKASIPAFSTADRKSMTSDLLFQAEELYILKDQRASVTLRTQSFLKSLFHPKTLGVANLSVSGQWENESLALSRQAVLAIDRAIATMTSCVQYGNGLPVRR